MHSISDIVQRVIFEVSHAIAFNVGFKFEYTRIYENFKREGEKKKKLNNLTILFVRVIDEIVG